MHSLHSRISLLLSSVGLCLSAQAEVRLPGIFTDHMVLQREQVNPIWGTAEADEAVTVQIGGQSHSTVADADGNWRVELNPLKVGGPYTLDVAGKNTVIFEDVLVGEVWFCSGQSNMELNLNAVNHADVEVADANNTHIRLFTVKKNATQEPQNDLGGEWVLSTSATAGQFSAVGYLFGKRLQHTLNVPIGLIDNSWSGSAGAAWVPREKLEASEIYDELLSIWDERAESYSDEIHAATLAEYKAWEVAGKPEPALSRPTDPRYSQNRPANIYNGLVHPLAGYGIRGVIWYQGESDVWQAARYRELFPLLITTWRNRWQQGDFPFYWVQVADFGNETTEPGNSHWAELREAQTMALSLPNTGEAVIIDAGEGRNIHPRDKQTVANRLVRHALAKDYGFDIASDSPRYTSMSIAGDVVTLKFDHVTAQLYAFDTTEVKGFSIAGEDQQYVWAEAKIVGKDRVEVWSELVANPVSVRYAWSNNPVANLQDRNGLQVTPFRTNDWAPVSNSPDAPVIQLKDDYQVTFPATLKPRPTLLDASPLDQLTIHWEQVSGPDEVSFSDSSSVHPEITFTQPGSYLLRLSVADSVYNSAVFTRVEVTRLPFPYGLPGTVFLGQSDFVSHDSRQDLSGGIIVDSDTSVTLHGNAWKSIPIDYTITPDTYISFTVNVADAGEYFGLIVDTDLNPINDQRVLILGGADYGALIPDWGFKIVPNKATSLNADVDYTIHLGELMTGELSRFGFMLNDDADASGRVTFSNVRIHEGAVPPPVVSLPLLPLPIEFNRAFMAHDSTQDSGNGHPSTVATSVEDTAVRIQGNVWKSMPYDYQVTARTVLEFSVMVNHPGEIMGVILDNDTNPTNEQRLLVVGGSDIKSLTGDWWFLEDLQVSERGASYHYVIPLGERFVGDVNNLGFFADDDDQGRADVLFSNVRLYELPATQTTETP